MYHLLKRWLVSGVYLCLPTRYTFATDRPQRGDRMLGRHICRTLFTCSPQYFSSALCVHSHLQNSESASLLQGSRLTCQELLSRKKGKSVAKSLRAVHLQLRGQLLIRPGLTVRLRQDAHRLVELSVDDTLFATTGSPDLIVAPFLLLDHLSTIQQKAHHLDDQF